MQAGAVASSSVEYTFRFGIFERFSMELLQPPFHRAESTVLHRITLNFKPSEEEEAEGYLRLRRGSFVLVCLQADISHNEDYYLGCTCGDDGSQVYDIHNSKRGKILKECVERVNENVVTPTATSRREQQQERREHRQQEDRPERNQVEENEMEREREQDEQRRQRQRQHRKMRNFFVGDTAKEHVSGCGDTEDPPPAVGEQQPKPFRFAKKASFGRCIICLTATRTHAFVPCGHLCVCQSCARRMTTATATKCPFCNQEAVGSAIKIYIP